MSGQTNQYNFKIIKVSQRQLIVTKEIFGIPSEIKNDIKKFNEFCFRQIDAVLTHIDPQEKIKIKEVLLEIKSQEIHICLNISSCDINNSTFTNIEGKKLANYFYIDVDLRSKSTNYINDLVADFCKYNYITEKSIMSSIIIYDLTQQHKMTYLWEINPKHLDILKTN